MCVSLVSFGDFGFYYDHFSVAYRTVCLAIVFGHIHDGGMWELGDGEAVCFQLFSFSLSVYWLEKFMLSHGALVVVIDRSCNIYDV